MAEENLQSGQSYFSINNQYIKDLSFENPTPIESFKVARNQPKVDVSLDVQVSNVEKETYEVALNIESKVSIDDNILFQVQLTYAGLFTLYDITDEHKEQVLAISCPSFLFPFARRILANVTQDGGFQPLLLDPIDFSALYKKRLQELQQQNKS